MADIREKIIFDDSEVIKGLTSQLDLITKVSTALKQTEKMYEEAFVVASDAVAETSKAIDKGTASIGNHIAETANAKKETAGWKGTLKELTGELNVYGVNLGRTVEQLKAKATAMKSLVTGIGSGVNALKLFKVALASTGIGILILAISSLITFFTKTERGAEKVERVMAGVGAVIRVITDRVSKLGESIVKFFSGDFKGAFNDAKAAVSGLNAELANEIRIMVNLKRLEQELEDARRANRVSDAENLVRLKQLQLLADDNTKSAKERLAAAKEADAIEKASLEERLSLEKRELGILYEKKSLGETTDADEDKIAEKKEHIAELQVSSLTLQRKLQSQIQGIEAESAAAQQERLDRIREANEALDTQIKKITDLFDKAANEQLSPEDKLRAEANAAILIIDEQFKILDAAARKAGKEVDLEKEKAELILLINNKLVEDLNKLYGRPLVEIANPLLPKKEDTEKEQDEFFKGIQDGYKKFLASKETLSVFDKIKVKLGEAFNLDEKQLNEAFSSIGNSLLSIYESFNSGTEAAIEANDELLNSIRERSETLDDELDKELERQELGLANNVEGKRREIEALKKEEEKAEKEREKLRKKQLAAKLIADGAQQASSLVTMAANVVAAESGKGLLGVAFAIAAIAAFLGIFTQIKNANKASKAYSGGKIDEIDTVTGFVNKSGRTDKWGGRGHRVEDSNLVLGGEEFVVNGNASNEHVGLLKGINEGKYAGRNLQKELAEQGMNSALITNQENAHNSVIIAALSSSRNDNYVAQAIDQSVSKHIGKLINVIKSKPDRFSYRPGDIVVEQTGDQKKIIQTEDDWRWSSKTYS